MDSGTAEDQTVELLMAHERALSALYKAFSIKFPEEQTFWQTLSKEAALHARMVGRLHIRIQAGEGIVREDRFDRQSIRASLTKIQRLIESLEYSDYALIDALRTAGLWPCRPREPSPEALTEPFMDIAIPMVLMVQPLSICQHRCIVRKRTLK